MINVLISASSVHWFLKRSELSADTGREGGGIDGIEGCDVVVCVFKFLVV